MEPVGIILFAILMAFMALQLIREGVAALITQDQQPIKVDFVPITLSCIGIGIKCLLWLYCRVLTYSPTALTLSQDHRNDIVLNTFGLTTAILGTHIFWWIDPMGAICIALLILRSWSATALEQIQLLVGKSASPVLLKKLIYIAMHHDPKILKVDTCRAFHVGNGTYVELDIVLSEDVPLRQSHDIAESLQKKIERVDGVERAFVHADYEFSHKATFEHKTPS